MVSQPEHFDHKVCAKKPVDRGRSLSDGVNIVWLQWLPQKDVQ